MEPSPALGTVPVFCAAGCARLLRGNGGKVLVFRKEPTAAELAEATSDPYEDWDPAPLAEPVPPAPIEPGAWRPHRPPGFWGPPWVLATPLEIRGGIF
jgi:hypothetical protein